MELDFNGTEKNKELLPSAVKNVSWTGLDYSFQENLSFLLLVPPHREIHVTNLLNRTCRNLEFVL